MSFSLIDCWGCGPTLADYVGLAIAAAVFVVPLFFWWSERAKRDLDNAKGLGLSRPD